MYIEGGYYIKARSIIESSIMRKPPYIREVWDWLLMKAEYEDKQRCGKLLQRGQLFTNLEEIKEGLAWYVGYRKETYTKDQMKKAMKALKADSMITTNKSTRGLIITICNYDIFQNPKNYESTSESTSESTNEAPMKHQTSTTIYKEENNLKIKNTPQTPQGAYDFFKWNGIRLNQGSSTFVTQKENEYFERYKEQGSKDYVVWLENNKKKG